MTEYRASFDASVSFSNGGDLAVHGFRVDVPAPDVDEAGIAALFVASLGLLMTDAVACTAPVLVPSPADLAPDDAAGGHGTSRHHHGLAIRPPCKPSSAHMTLPAVGPRAFSADRRIGAVSHRQQ